MDKSEIIDSASDIILDLTVSDVRDERLVSSINRLIRNLNEMQVVLRFPIRSKEKKS